MPHREWVINNLKTNEEFQTPEGSTVVERKYQPNDNTVTEIFTIVTPAERRVFLLRYRIFDGMELERLLRSSELKIRGIFGGYEDVPLDTESPTVVMLAVND